LSNCESNNCEESEKNRPSELFKNVWILWIIKVRFSHFFEIVELAIGKEVKEKYKDDHSGDSARSVENEVVVILFKTMVG
jgi:hypothetical protein